MGDYEHTAQIQRTTADVYAYVAEVGRLPEYMTAMRSVRPGQGNTVEVTAVVDGQSTEGEAWLETDDSQHRLRWGAEGPNDYHGELTVTPDGEEASTVTVTLHTEHADGPGVRMGLDETLANIKSALEGRSVDTA